jgi:hypothetical protein
VPWHLHQRLGIGVEQPDAGIDQHASAFIADGTMEIGVGHASFADANEELVGRDRQRTAQVDDDVLRCEVRHQFRGVLIKKGFVAAAERAVVGTEVDIAACSRAERASAALRSNS